MLVKNNLLLSVAMMFTVCGVVGGSTTACRAQAAPTKKQFQEMYDKIAAGAKKKDIKSTEEMLAPDMIWKGQGMTMKRDEWLKTIEAQMKSTTSISVCTMTVNSVKKIGDKVQVESVFHMTAEIVDSKGDMGPKGKSHKLNETSTSHDTWAKIGGKWKAVLLDDQPGSKVLVDGKPLQPQGAKGK